jgi:hypothetical protein
MKERILANFIQRCYELGITSHDCHELMQEIAPDPLSQIAALRLWMEESDAV